jgi:hypothetical protein
MPDQSGSSAMVWPRPVLTGFSTPAVKPAVVASSATPQAVTESNRRAIISGRMTGT